MIETATDRTRGYKQGTDGRYDDSYYWVGHVRLLTWAVREGQTEGRHRALVDLTRAGEKLEVAVQVGRADYMVSVYSSLDIVWGVPCFEYGWEADLVVRELEDLLTELRRRCGG